MLITLYTAEGCHLCEQAQQVLNQAGLNYQLVDIALDEQLVEQYGIRIPVLAYNGKELGWPFDGQAVSKFLE
ncbi:glutaredoxin family protein [Motilimonas eburnea]|uniref:glutaredoxin family protein n=1 Tax=Motilimonas eburnea TaxID=1737488 RepID=UPI001E2C0266|nr:glutaredoxin family protein [Motilimonas eburnea]